MNEYLHKLEDTAVDVISVFGPWLGPIPSAYLVGRAAENYLHWHTAVAWIAAVAVESIGVVSVVLALRLYEWNETRRKTDPAAPFGLAVALVAVYFVVTIGLTVLLDVAPALARYAPAVFPLLAAVGAVNIAIKNGQRRRETAVAQEKAAKSAAKSGEKRRHVAGNMPETSGKHAGNFPADWRKLTPEMKQRLAAMTAQELETAVPSLSERARRHWRTRLSQNGYHEEK